MPIPQTIRVNPLDLRKNIAIGVSLPFNGPKGPFNSTYNTKDQIKYNLINLLLTSKGERVFNPEFGLDLREALFEPMTEDLTALIKNIIITGINTFVPEVTIDRLDVNQDIDNQTVSVTVRYSLIVSGTSDQITVQFI
jgi:phage baseplate assembly protein W